MDQSRQPSRILLSLALPALVLGVILTACSARATALPATATPAPAAVSVTPPPAPATVTKPAMGPIAIDTFTNLKSILKEIRTADPAPAQARADALWQILVDGQRVPWVLGTQVVFFYKGEAELVQWRGSFNKWQEPGLAGVRLGQSDLWIAYTDLPAESRAEYKIVLNNKDWIVDPANPKTAFSGLTGVNNVVTMPGFSVSDESQKRGNVAQGGLTDALTLDSRSLGYPVNYRVYTPAGYQSLERLPVIYVLDGNDFSDERMGALPNILDNLIADGRIKPVLAVFADAREPGNPSHNRREAEFLERPIEHAQFIADELAPAIDLAYPTDPRPEARVIMGVSYGGLSAYYIAASRSDVFHNVAAFSPSLWALNNPQYLANAAQREGSQKMLSAVAGPAVACGGESGYPCPRLPVKVFLTTGLPDWDVGDMTGLVGDLKLQRYPVEFYQVREGHTWDNWRGLTDEMLLYFFSSR